MYDIALNAKKHELIIENGDMLLINNAERIAQQIKITILEWLGEWFLDLRDGVPYREYVLIKNPNLNHIRSILITKMSAVNGVDKVKTMTLDLDKKNRVLTVDFEVLTSFGLITRREVLGYGE